MVISADGADANSVIYPAWPQRGMQIVDRYRFIPEGETTAFYSRKTHDNDTRRGELRIILNDFLLCCRQRLRTRISG